MQKTSQIDALNAMMPIRRARAVTPADGAALPLGVADTLFVGGAGDVAVIPEDDTVAVVFKAVPAGTFLPVRAKSVQATNTTATFIVAGY